MDDNKQAPANPQDANKETKDSVPTEKSSTTKINDAPITIDMSEIINEDPSTLTETEEGRKRKSPRGATSEEEERGEKQEGEKKNKKNKNKKKQKKNKPEETSSSSSSSSSQPPNLADANLLVEPSEDKAQNLLDVDVPIELVPMEPIIIPPNLSHPAPQNSSHVLFTFHLNNKYSLGKTALGVTGNLPQLGEWKRFHLLHQCTRCASGRHYTLSIPLTVPILVNDHSEEWFQYKFVFVDDKGNFQYEHRTEGVSEFQNRSVPKHYVEHFAPSIAQPDSSTFKKIFRKFTTVLTLMIGESIPAFNVFASCVVNEDVTNVSQVVRRVATIVECLGNEANIEQIREAMLTDIVQGFLTTPYKTLLYGILLRRAFPKNMRPDPLLMKAIPKFIEALSSLSVAVLLQNFRLRDVIDALELEEFFYTLTFVIQKSIGSSEYAWFSCVPLYNFLLREIKTKPVDRYHYDKRALTSFKSEELFNQAVSLVPYQVLEYDSSKPSSNQHLWRIMLELAPSVVALAMLPITFSSALSLRIPILEAITRSIEASLRDERGDKLITSLGAVLTACRNVKNRDLPEQNVEFIGKSVTGLITIVRDRLDRAVANCPIFFIRNVVDFMREFKEFSIANEAFVVSMCNNSFIITVPGHVDSIIEFLDICLEKATGVSFAGIPRWLTRLFINSSTFDVPSVVKLWTKLLTSPAYSSQKDKDELVQLFRDFLGKFRPAQLLNLFRDWDLFAQPDLRRALVDVAVQNVQKPTGNSTEVWDRVSGLQCPDQKVTWRLQAAYIQSRVPQTDAPLTELFKCTELSMFLRWYTQKRKAEGAKIGKEFPELEQLSTRIKELAKNVINGSIVMEEMEMMFAKSGRQDTNIDVNERILGFFKECDCQPDMLQLQKAGQDLALLRSDLANVQCFLYRFCNLGDESQGTDEDSIIELKEMFTQLTESWGDTSYNDVKDHALLKLGVVARKEMSFMQVVKDSPIFLNIWEQTFREMFASSDITECEEAADDLAGLPLESVSHIKLATKFIYMLLPYAAATWSGLYERMHIGSITFRELSTLRAEGPLDALFQDFRVLFHAAGFRTASPGFTERNPDGEFYVGISGNTFQCTEMQIFALQALRNWLHTWKEVHPAGWDTFVKRIEAFNQLTVKRRNLGIMIALKSSLNCEWDVAELERMDQQITTKWETITLKDALDYARKLDQLQLTMIGPQTSEYLANLVKAKELVTLLRGGEFSDHNNFQTFISMCNEFTDSHIETQSLEDLRITRELLKSVLYQKDVLASLSSFLQTILALKIDERDATEHLVDRLKTAISNINMLQRLKADIELHPAAKAITMLKEIVKTGIFVFVAPTKNDKNFASCVRLEKPDSAPVSLDQLEELRSKLVLGVAVEEPEIERLIDYFQSLLLHVHAISATLIQLFVAGHYEYQTFQLRLDPQIKDAFPAIAAIENIRKKMTGVEKSQIEIELAKNTLVKSQLSRIDFVLRNSIEYYQNVGTDLKAKLATWNASVDGLRKTAPYINYFTVSQCMQLIHNFSYKRDPDVDFVFNLLRTINPKVERARVASYLQDINIKPYEGIPSLVKLSGEIAKFLSVSDIAQPSAGTNTILQRGVPNIIVSASEELLLHHLITLYEKHTQRAPYSYEVLFCEESTPFEEIELLLRRCSNGSSSGKPELFCMANMHKMTYAHQAETVRLFQHFCASNTGTPRNFYLALLTMQTSQGQHLLSIFSSFIIPQAVPFSKRDLRGLFATTQAKVYSSELAGAGKSHTIQQASLKSVKEFSVLAINGPLLVDQLIQLLEDQIAQKGGADLVFHINIAPTINDALNILLYQLLIVGTLVHSNGRVFHKRSNDEFLLEIPTSFQSVVVRQLYFLQLLPQEILEAGPRYFDVLEPHVQFVCKWLLAYENGRLHATVLPAGTIDPDVAQDDGRWLIADGPNVDAGTCIRLLQRYGGVMHDKQSYIAAVNFIKFFTLQLDKVSRSEVFKKNYALALDCPNFIHLMFECLVETSADFCRRSFEEKSMSMDESDVSATFKLKVKWEDSQHPIVVFNEHGGGTVSFIQLDPSRLDLTRRQVLESQRVHLPNYQTNEITVGQASELLETVFGRPVINTLQDELQGYVLTIDNILKIVSIYFRILSGIPVIIMGETGCGKTALIDALCKMTKTVLLKRDIHGGITDQDITSLMAKAIHVANNLTTATEVECSFCGVIQPRGFASACCCCDMPFGVQRAYVFLDEINTAACMGLFKEIICDHSIKGKKLPSNLVVIAACNPYRSRLDDNPELYTGFVPRTFKPSKLVYLVHPLPETMTEYVWDIGSLKEKEELQYIERMMNVNLPNSGVAASRQFQQGFCRAILESHKFIRKITNEPSSVSLRDVARCLKMNQFFHKHFQMQQGLADLEESIPANLRGYKSITVLNDNDAATHSMLLSLAHCYYYRLSKENRDDYINLLASHSTKTPKAILRIILEIQLDYIRLMNVPPGIAVNQALRENVFMMLTCILNQIPLFVVGKPGSSKSLAMQIIRESFNRETKSKRFAHYPAIEVVSYQCSPMSEAKGIEDAFNAAKRIQRAINKSGTPTIAVVNLDEVGLAEISPHLPLKVLHKLLEHREDEPSGASNPWMQEKVAVVGLSNWALDPAKMSRALYLNRPFPTTKDLAATALGIIASSENHNTILAKELNHIAEAYIDLCENFDKARDFYGLRDFYQLVKYLHRNMTSRDSIDLSLLSRAVCRNFGGSEEFRRNNLNLFATKLGVRDSRFDVNEWSLPVVDLIRDNITTQRKEPDDARHLMVLSKNDDSVLRILFDPKNKILDHKHTTVIINSDFREDKTSLYISRNMDRIKRCMELGETVVLLHQDELYESLYDMLNQHYTKYGNRWYCRLALGLHSRPCPVHPNFRCVVIVDADRAYTSSNDKPRLPPPFLNRHEKQELSLKDELTPIQAKAAVELQTWIEQFAEVVGLESILSLPAASFLGYSEETCSSVMSMIVSNFRYFTNRPSKLESVNSLAKEPGDADRNQDRDQDLVEKGISQLLWMALPESIVRSQTSKLAAYSQNYWRTYFKEQPHDNLLSFLSYLNVTYPDHNGHSIFALTYSTLVLNLESKVSGHPLVVGHSIVINLSDLTGSGELTKLLSAFFSQKDTNFCIIECDMSISSAYQVMHTKYICDKLRASFRDSAEPKHIMILQFLSRSRRDNTYCGYDPAWLTIVLDSLGFSELEHGFPSTSVLCDTSASASPYHVFQQQSLEDMLRVLRTHARHLFFRLNYPSELLEQIDPSQRIMLLESLLTPSTNEYISRFQKYMRDRLLKLLLQEHESGSIHTLRWQEELAKDSQKIAKAGSFRMALILYLSDVLVNVWASLLSVLDSNLNVDLLGSKEEELCKLWVKLFECDTLFPNVHTKHSRTGIDVRPPAEAAGFVQFRGSFPFSFMIFYTLESMKERVLETYEGEDYDHESLSQSLTTMMAATALSPILSNLSQECFAHYLNDFVLIIRNTTDLPELTYINIVEKCILKVLGSSTSIVDVHSWYWVYEKNIRSILQMITFLQKDGEKLFNKTITTRNLNLHDVVAVFLKSVVQSLRPTPAILSSPAQKKKWVQSMDSANVYISGQLQNAGEAHECVGEWQIISLCYQFVKSDLHVSKLVSSADQFWMKISASSNGCNTFEMFSVVREFLLSKAPHTLDSQGLFAKHLQSFMECYLMDFCFGTNSSWPDHRLIAEISRIICAPPEHAEVSAPVQSAMLRKIIGRLGWNKYETSAERSLVVEQLLAAQKRKAVPSCHVLYVETIADEHLKVIDNHAKALRVSKVENHSSVVYGRWEWSDELGASLEFVAKMVNHKARATGANDLDALSNKLEACGLAHCFVPVFAAYVIQFYEKRLPLPDILEAGACLVFEMSKEECPYVEGFQTLLFKQLSHLVGSQQMSTILRGENFADQFEWVKSSNVHVFGYGKNVPRDIIFPSVTKSFPNTENVSFDIVREVLNTAMRVNFQALPKFVEETGALGDQHRRLVKHYLLLSIYQEISTSICSGNTLAAQFIESFRGWIAHDNKLLMDHERPIVSVVANITETPQNLPIFSVTNFTTLQDMLILQTMSHVIASVMASRTEWSYFHALLFDPATFMDKFLITMEDDPKADIIRLLRQQGRTIYICANGHLYAVGGEGPGGACPTPTQPGRCHACGLAIGQNSTNPVFQTELLDQSPKGYALGIAANHQDPTTVYRDLSPTTLHTLRFIMHTLIYAHASNTQNLEQLRRVAQLLKQPPQSVCEFLARHLRANWEMLRHLLACNDDNLSALLHLVVAEYTKASQNAPNTNFGSFGKPERHAFEVFMTTLCNSIYENRHQRLQALYQDIQQTGDDNEKKLSSELQETLDLTTAYEPYLQSHLPALLRYRQPLTYNNFFAAFDMDSSNAKSFPLLGHFLHNEPKLRCVRHLPAILVWIYRLHARFTRRLARKEAGELTIGQAILQLPASMQQQWTQAFLAFKDGWNEAREFVTWCEAAHRNPGKEENKDKEKLNRDFMPELSENSPLSLCLCSESNEGLFPLELVRWLVAVQNELLDRGNERGLITQIGVGELAKITSPSHGLQSGDMVVIADTNCFPPIEGTLEVAVTDKNTFTVAYDIENPGDKGRWVPLNPTMHHVPLHLVNNEHIFVYDFNNSIEPFIVSQTEYSLKYGEGSVAKYNFENINNFLVKYISGKPHLQQQIALFEFSDDHRGLTILRIISEKIPQTDLDDDVITRIRQLLDTVDKVEQEKKCIGDCIGFLKFKASSILPVEPMTSLYEYASKVVKTKEEYLGSIPLQLQHIQALWHLLDAMSGDPYGDIPASFQNPLDDPTKEAIHKSIYNLQHNLADLLPIWENFIRGKEYFTLATKTLIRDCLENWEPTFKTVDLSTCNWFKRNFPAQLSLKQLVTAYIEYKKFKL